VKEIKQLATLRSSKRLSPQLQPLALTLLQDRQEVLRVARKGRGCIVCVFPTPRLARRRQVALGLSRRPQTGDRPAPTVSRYTCKMKHDAASGYEEPACTLPLCKESGVPLSWSFYEQTVFTLPQALCTDLVICDVLVEDSIEAKVMALRELGEVHLRATQ